MERYLTSYVIDDLSHKMVFIGGPRQAGKTTLAQNIGVHNFKNSLYLNWDNRDDRKKIIKAQFSSEVDLIIFDEIHKYQDWKNYLKGIFDKHKDEFSIIATGSARLNIYRKGGDSLMGRYFYSRIHPLSLAEIHGIKNDFTKICKLIFHNNVK